MATTSSNFATWTFSKQVRVSGCCLPSWLFCIYQCCLFRPFYQLVQASLQLDRHRTRGLQRSLLLQPCFLPRHHQVWPAASPGGRLDYAARRPDWGVVFTLGVAQPIQRHLRRGWERPVDCLPGPGWGEIHAGDDRSEPTEPDRPQHAAGDHLEDRAQEEPLWKLLHRVRRPVCCGQL